MRTARLALLAPLLLAVGCAEDGTSPLAPSEGAPEVELSRGGAAGAVYVATNGVAGNEILVFARRGDGSLAAPVAHPTGGLGTGGGLGNQGGVALSGDGRLLAVVNAGSDEVSTFRVSGQGLELAGTVASGGDEPVSIALHGRLAYVLNDGASPGVHGFRVGADGQFSPIPGSGRPLSGAPVSDAAQVSFTPDGSRLVVTEKATNLITTYDVYADGTLGPPVSQASAAPTPFGFAFDKRGTLLASEANGGAPGASFVSSYRLAGAGWTTISGAVPTTQTAACWVAVTPDGKFAYATNTGSASISGFTVAPDGSLALLSSGVSGMTDASPIDVSISRNGRFLYALNATSHTISSFRIGSDGSLTPLGSTGGLPAGANGLAAD